MTLLQIDQDEITCLVEQSKFIPDSFGIDTLVIQLEDYKGLRMNVRDYGDPYLDARMEEKLGVIRARLSGPIHDFIEEHPLADSWGISEEALTERFAEIILDEKFCGYSWRNVSRDFSKFAHHYGPNVYEEPVSAIVLIPHSGFSAIDHMNVALSSPLASVGQPASDQHWQYFTNWHERSHLTGAGEPQAQMMSSVVYMQGVKDSSVIKASADWMAVETVLQAHDDSRREGFGWPMVEGVDHVANLFLGDVNSLGHEDIKRVRFQRFNHLSFVVETLGRKVEPILRDKIKETPRFETVASAVKPCIHSGNFDKTEQKMLKRFVLACERQAVGPQAYENAEGLIDNEILDSEHEKPLTFTPGEYIPG